MGAQAQQGDQEAIRDLDRDNLPFGLSGEPLACPFAVGDSVGPRDVNDRVIHPVSDSGAGALWSAPVCPLNLPPPVRFCHGLGDGSGDKGRYEEMEHEGPVVTLALIHTGRGG